MTDSYEIKPPDPPPTPPLAPLSTSSDPAGPTAESASTEHPSPPSPPKPGDPGWIPPTVIVEKAAPDEPDSSIDPDIEKNKGIAVLGYVCFLVPLVLAPNSKFARYHANQGLLAFILLCVAVMGVVILHYGGDFAQSLMVSVTVLHMFFGCIFTVLQPALLLGWVALVIYGIIQAANGEKKGLPIVGHWTLIK